MEHLKIEKIRAAWMEVDTILQKVEKNGVLNPLDTELLKNKLLATYEALLAEPEKTVQGVSPVADHSVPTTSKHMKDKVVESTVSEKDKTTVISTTESKQEVEKDEKKQVVPEEKKTFQSPVRNATIKTPEAQAGKTSEVFGEKLRSSQKLIHDELAEKIHTGRQDVSSAIQSKPIENIEKAIGLNDKFLFIKELFNNNGQLYKETVEHLNSANNQNEALQYIQSGFNWDDKDPVVQKFLDLVKRRHQ